MHMHAYIICTLHCVRVCDFQDYTHHVTLSGQDSPAAFPGSRTQPGACSGQWRVDLATRRSRGSDSCFWSPTPDSDLQEPCRLRREAVPRSPGAGRGAAPRQASPGGLPKAPTMAAVGKQESRKSGRREDPAKAIERGKQLLASLRQKKPEEIVMTEGVPQSTYLGYIKRELDNENACLELPLTIIMLVSFLTLALFLLNQSQIFAVEEGVFLDIEENANFAWAHNFGHKVIYDVNSVADFWSWFRLGYLPLVVQPKWMYSEAYPPSLGAPVFDGTSYTGSPHGPDQWMFSDYERATPHRNDYLRYNRIMGGIKLRQWTASPSKENCRIPLSFNFEQTLTWLGKPCVPSGQGLMSLELLDVETFDNSVRRQFLLPEIESLDEMRKVLIDMEDGCHHSTYQGSNIQNCRCKWCKEQTPLQPWIDEQTERVEIAFIMFNPVYGMYTYVGTNFIFNRGGHIHKLINCMSVWADPLTLPFLDALPTYIAGFVWVASLIYVVFGEIREMIQIIRSSHERFYKAIWEDYIAIWNVVDWVSIVVSCVVVYLWLEMRQIVDVANLQFVDMVKVSQATQAGMSAVDRDVYEDTAAAFFVGVENSVLAEKTFRITMAIYPNMLMLRLFKSFAAQPRLAVVTATLTRAAPDLLHFFIVFLSVYLCMVVNSVLLFGQDMQDFSTMLRAIMSCFRAMFGDWDWVELKDIGYLKAQIWFWGFMLIMVLILLNMLLAMFMDAYTAVKKKASNAQTLSEQMFDMKRRRGMYTRGERVRLNDIWNVFAAEYNGDEHLMLNETRKITVEFLMENVPMLQFTQAKRTLTNSVISEQRISEGDIYIYIYMYTHDIIYIHIYIIIIIIIIIIYYYKLYNIVLYYIMLYYVILCCITSGDIEEDKIMDDIRATCSSLRNRTQYIIKECVCAYV